MPRAEFLGLVKAIDPSEVHQELSDRLREELDYAREAKHMQLYRHMLADEPGVHVLAMPHAPINNPTLPGIVMSNIRERFETVESPVARPSRTTPL